MITLIKNNNKAKLKAIATRTHFENEEIESRVKAILKDVYLRKDEAVKEYTAKFDLVTLDSLKVSKDEIDEAFKACDPKLVGDLEYALNNIKRYHKRQMLKDFKFKSFEGAIVGQKVSAIERVGLYVPGGKAAYPSTVLMTAVPAKLAGVKSLVMVTPPQKDGSIKPSILVAAKLAGVDEIYKVGGAQAIGALAYGTESILAVDKIVGPGNLYVALAKKAVHGLVGIDMIAGPSEIVVVADDTCDATVVAYDLMSQAEHDEQASAILITESNAFANKVKEALETLLPTMSRKTIIEKSLKDYGAIFISASREETIDLINTLAPEHLELMIDDYKDYLPLITNAGAIFMGKYTPEAVGDYLAGPNHTLPTSSTARFSSALSTSDFQTKTSLIKYTERALNETGERIIRLAEEEMLEAHAKSVASRLRKGAL